MLDHALDKLVAAGIKRAVVNTHYLADQIENHLQSRHDIDIIISREDELLDTGGSIVKALSHFGGKPFFTLNSDFPWIDVRTPSLTRMQQMWNPDIMDVLLLVMQTTKARGFDPLKGDFILEANGELRRLNLRPPLPYVYISAQILKSEPFATPPSKVFSNRLMWEKAETKRRLFGIEHDGTGYHVGTPEDLKIANDLLISGKGWSV
jgi:MurNAc alpha-1-phosphate uridylyltransferase